MMQLNFPSFPLNLPYKRMRKREALFTVRPLVFKSVSFRAGVTFYSECDYLSFYITLIAPLNLTKF